MPVSRQNTGTRGKKATKAKTVEPVEPTPEEVVHEEVKEDQVEKIEHQEESEGDNVPDPNNNDVDDNNDNEDEDDLKKEIVRKTSKKSKSKKSYGILNAGYVTAKQKRQQKEQAMLRDMSPDSKLKYREEKAQKKASAALKKVEYSKNFAKMAEEMRERRKNMTAEEKEEDKKKRKARAEHKQAGLVFPVARLNKAMRNEFRSHKHTKQTAVFMAAVLEYMTAELLELAGNCARDYKRKTIKPRHIMLAARNDEEIDKVIGQHCIFMNAGRYPAGVQPMLRKNHASKNNADWNIDMDMRKFTIAEK
jgi:histone H2A